MKQKYEITISGGCKTFKGYELVARICGDYKTASKKRSELEKLHGRIMYLAIAKQN